MVVGGSAEEDFALLVPFGANSPLISLGAFPFEIKPTNKKMFSSCRCLRTFDRTSRGSTFFVREKENVSVPDFPLGLLRLNSSNFCLFDPRSIQSLSETFFQLGPSLHLRENLASYSNAMSPPSAICRIIQTARKPQYTMRCERSDRITFISIIIEKLDSLKQLEHIKTLAPIEKDSSHLERIVRSSRDVMGCMANSELPILRTDAPR